MAKSPVNLQGAKTHLSCHLDRATSGQEVALQRPKRKLIFGLLKGRVKLARHFDASLPGKLWAAFEGRKSEIGSDAALLDTREPVASPRSPTRIRRR